MACPGTVQFVRSRLFYPPRITGHYVTERPARRDMASAEAGIQHAGHPVEQLLGILRLLCGIAAQCETSSQ